MIEDEYSTDNSPMIRLAKILCDNKPYVGFYTSERTPRKSLNDMDYVILHELAHLSVRNHGKDFIAIMDSYMPYWRDVRKELNDSKLDYMEPEEDYIV